MDDDPEKIRQTLLTVIMRINDAHWSTFAFRESRLGLLKQLFDQLSEIDRMMASKFDDVIRHDMSALRHSASMVNERLSSSPGKVFPRASDLHIPELDLQLWDGQGINFHRVGEGEIPMLPFSFLDFL